MSDQNTNNQNEGTPQTEGPQFQQDPTMNLAAMIQNARPVLPPAEEEQVIQPTAAENLGETLNEEVVQPQEETRGFVVSQDDLKDSNERANLSANEIPDFGNTVENYLKEMESDSLLTDKLDVLQKFAPEGVDSFKEEVGLTPSTEEKEEDDSEEELSEEEQDQKDLEQFQKDVSVATVMIDKMNTNLFTFTPEQQEKLERSKVIKVKEVETVRLATLRTRKPKGKGSVKKVNQRRSQMNVTPVVLPSSGYITELGGASAHELLALAQSMENPLLDTQTRWSLLFDKLHNPSIPVSKDFNKFLEATAFSDYDMLIYGILCSTYPDSDSVTLTCDNEKCGKSYEHKYAPRDLLRYEELASSEKLAELVKNAVDAAIVTEDALAYHETAPVNTVRAIELPDSKIVVEICTQSAHDFINKSVQALADNADARYEQAMILTTMINRALVPDFEDGEVENPFYDEYEDPSEIAELIFGLRDVDILALTSEGEKTNNNKFSFGFSNVVCPHCKKTHATYAVDIEQILFLRFQQATSTSVE